MWYNPSKQSLVEAASNNFRKHAQMRQCKLINEQGSESIHANCPCETRSQCPFIDQFGKLRKRTTNEN